MPSARLPTAVPSCPTTSSTRSHGVCARAGTAARQNTIRAAANRTIAHPRPPRSVDDAPIARCPQRRPRPDAGPEYLPMFVILCNVASSPKGQPMTMSIVARCVETGQFGVAAATAVPAVGKLLTHALPGVGAVATQARLNPYLGIDGLALLREGLEAAEVRERLAAMDPRSDLRQFAVIDAAGRTA